MSRRGEYEGCDGAKWLLISNQLVNARKTKRRFVGVEKEDMRVGGVSEEDEEQRVSWRKVMCVVTSEGAADRQRRRNDFFDTELAAQVLQSRN